MTSPACILQARGLCLGYGRRRVLSDLDFDVCLGEFWVCLGPNGEGKTTLLRALLGELAPQAGQLWCHPELASRARLGFVPQRCELNPTLPTTVREFVLLGAVGSRQRPRAADVEWALQRVGLQGLARASYWTLSGGQRQRALLARALIRRPTLLLLDEPTNGLDLPTAAALLRFLAAWQRGEGVTVFFVTHDLTVAAHYATHVMLLAGGKGTAGPAAAVLHAAALRRAYGVAVEVVRHATGAVSIQVDAGGDAA